MKRLHSYWTYPFVLFPLLLGFYLTYLLFTNYDISIRSLLVGTILNITFIALFIGLFTIFKRVYVQGSSLYVYDLHSNTPYVLSLEQLRVVERDNSPRTILLGTYNISFLIEDGSYYTVSFMKNKLIFNLRKYI